MAHEAQVRYSQLVDLKLRATLVKKVGVICNNRYEGSPKAGSVKVPVRDTEVVVNDYNKSTGAKRTEGDTSYITVNIDHDKAVNEIIDGFDAESVPGDLVADRLDSAGYSLALQADTDGSVELTTAPKRSLSAPSARRATHNPAAHQAAGTISIHALREEGDAKAGCPRTSPYDFYPRPPRGGRHKDGGGRGDYRQFLSTPSARRATLLPRQVISLWQISIHALREEGDYIQCGSAYTYCNFYPRPPRGGRRMTTATTQASSYFYPRPPRGGRRSARLLSQTRQRNFYPRPP